MESQNETPKKEIELKEALEAGLIHGKIGEALKEFYEWYDWRYVMPVRIILGEDYITILIEYNIEAELEECVEACVKNVKEDSLAEELNDHEIRAGCYDMCDEDISRDTNSVFGDIRWELFKCLDKHRLNYSWEDSWDYNVKYLAVTIRL